MGTAQITGLLFYLKLKYINHENMYYNIFDRIDLDIKGFGYVKIEQVLKYKKKRLIKIRNKNTKEGRSTP
ncbi:MAG: hypothetical protein Q4P31_01880 [Andreesenia angusta]|nr:hypothetical protein [Andreesenia angusta]